MPTAFNLVWDADGQRKYETGVDRGVIYQKTSGADPYPKGVAWNGLTAATERPSGGDPSSYYADNIEYLKLRAAEKFGVTIEAYTYPDEFAECDGSAIVVAGVYAGQQRRKAFGFSYRTLIGNDEEENDYGYKIHLVYGLTASPSERNRNTVNESPEPGNFSWECEAQAIKLDGSGFRPVAHIEIDSTQVDATLLAQLETILYGTAATTGTNASPAVEGRLPLPLEVFQLFGWTPPAG